MITDEERREVAMRMREILRDDPHGLLDAMVVNAVTDVMGEGVAIGETVADLIDRPTCYVIEHKTHCGSYGCEEAGQLWVLSCGDECVNDSDFPPGYCPECGAEVTEECGCDVREI